MSVTRFFAAALFVLFACLFTACAQSPQNAESKGAPPNTAVNLPDQPATEGSVSGPSEQPSSGLSENQLPSSVLGTFNQDQEACSSGMFAKLTVSADELQFYYGYAEINSVTRQGEGYDIDATFFQQEGVVEVRPEATTYRIEPGEQEDTILFKNTPTGQPLSLFVRCDEP